MSEFRLRFATDELERAQREAERARLAWKIGQAAHPSMVDIDTLEAYCEAANAAAEAQNDYDTAVAEAQAEWHAEWQRTQGGPSTPLDPHVANGSGDVGWPLAARPSPDAAARSVRPAVHLNSRED